MTNIRSAAFVGCYNLTAITIPSGVASIEEGAFGDLYNLTKVYFEGDAPLLDWEAFADTSATIYYLPGTARWGAKFSLRPTVLWTLEALTDDARFGVRNGQFGFTFTWASDRVMVVEAATDLAHPIWTPVSTNTLTGGTSTFSDPDWASHPALLYRVIAR